MSQGLKGAQGWKGAYRPAETALTQLVRPATNTGECSLVVVPLPSWKETGVQHTRSQGGGRMRMVSQDPTAAWNREMREVARRWLNRFFIKNLAASQPRAKTGGTL